LKQHQALLRHERTETYEAILGIDPDRIEISVASSLTGAPISNEDWHAIHGSVYAIE
jgi:hypothetical protein